MNPHRLAATAAAGVLLLASAAACTDDEPRTGTVGQPTPAEHDANRGADTPTADGDADDNGDNGDNDSGGETGENDPTHQAPPNDDPTEYETAEDMPDELLQKELEALVSDFLKESNRAGASGDTSVARSMAEEECTVCHQQLDSIDDDYAAGNRWVGGEFDEDFTLEIVAIEGNVIETHVRGSYGALKVVDEDGTEKESYDDSDFLYYLGIDRREDGTYIIAVGENYT